MQSLHMVIYTAGYTLYNCVCKKKKRSSAKIDIVSTSWRTKYDSGKSAKLNNVQNAKSLNELFEKYWDK